MFQTMHALGRQPRALGHAVEDALVQGLQMLRPFVNGLVLGRRVCLRALQLQQLINLGDARPSNLIRHLLALEDCRSMKMPAQPPAEPI